MQSRRRTFKNTNQFPTFIPCRNEKKSTSPEKSQSYNIFNSNQTIFSHQLIQLLIHKEGYNHSKLTSLFPISFISLKASLAILAAIPMNTPLAKPFTSKTFADSKPPKLEILPPTLTSQHKGSHAWRFWKYRKIKLSPISVSRLRNVLKIAIL